MKQIKYTIEDFDNFEKDGIQTLCPTGDYSGIKKIPNCCSFGSNSVFGDNTFFGYHCYFENDTIFGDNCSFGYHCRFGHGTLFGCHCSFGESCDFSNCNFGDYCEFGEFCHFNMCYKLPNNCKFGDFSDFSSGVSFGEYNTFGRSCDFSSRCQFESHNVFGTECHFGEDSKFYGACHFGIGCTFENDYVVFIAPFTNSFEGIPGHVIKTLKFGRIQCYKTCSDIYIFNRDVSHDCMGGSSTYFHQIDEYIQKLQNTIKYFENKKEHFAELVCDTKETLKKVQFIKEFMTKQEALPIHIITSEEVKTLCDKFHSATNSFAMCIKKRYPYFCEFKDYEEIVQDQSYARDFCLKILEIICEEDTDMYKRIHAI